jgi:FMN-dependent oxidoreductase (nitrilotriacetate monooxygenase family)
MREIMFARKMNLVAYLKTGPTAMHSGGWRHPEAVVNDIFDPLRYEQTALLLESAKLDGCFFADFFGFVETFGGYEMFARAGGQNSYLDPLLVLPIMARVTRNLGLGVTISTSFFNSYHIARTLATIDILSKGRVAWNVVTSTNDVEAKNAGIDTMPPHDERYDRADEVLEACTALWKTWEPDAFILDKERGIFADPSKIHYANYEGKWVKSRGPLPTPPSPQGQPVIMQAGSSDRGRDFAARWAEIVFTPDQDLAKKQAFYKDMQERMAKFGRTPDQCKILPAVTPIIGETESIAREKADYLESLKEPEYDAGYASAAIGADLRKHATAESVEQARGHEGSHGAAAEIADVARRQGTSLKEAADKQQRMKALVGTPKSIADQMQHIFESGACDGFVIMPVSFPTAHEQFCRAVVPELQRRGLFRTEYTASTLRGNLRS